MRAYIPWSPDMEALVQLGLSLDHPRVADLRENCRLIELKKMLIRYDLRRYNINDTKNAMVILELYMKRYSSARTLCVTQISKTLIYEYKRSHETVQKTTYNKFWDFQY